VAAVWMRFRVELRSSWRAWLTLAVLTGIAGGVLVTAAAGARRTDSALARHLAAYGYSDVGVFTQDLSALRLAEKLPQVAAASVGEELDFHARDAQGRDIPVVGPKAMLMYASTDGRDGVALNRWKLLAGRRPEPNRLVEAVLDSRAARTFGVGVGDTVGLRVSDQAVRVRVVGVVAATDPVNHPAGVVHLTPAFYRAFPGSGFDFILDARLGRGSADLAAFRRGIARVRTVGPVVDRRDVSRGIQGSIHNLAQALWVGTALGAFLSLLVLAQSFARLAGSAALQFPTLRAVGMTGRQLVALGIARAGTIALGAAALTVAISAASSPLTPIGYARELEPKPGFAVDLLAFGLGGAAVLAAVLLVGSLAAWRAARPCEPGLAEGTGRVRAADALARRGLPAPMATGVRFALARGRSSRAVPVGSALVGAVLAVVVVGAALTFSASLHHLFSTPRLFGQNWDYRSEWAAERPTAVATIERDPSISAVALGDDKSFVSVEGRHVGVRAMHDIKGSLPPTVIEGRAPRREGEILLGTKTMHALGLRIGDTVEVRGTLGERMRIVGRGVLPTGYALHNDLGEGAAMTWSTAVRIGATIGGAYVLQARIAPGADRARTLAKLQRLLVAPAPGLPAPVADFGGVSELPAVISALLVAVAIGALAQTLVFSVRRRRRDLAILKTLGFDRRQVLSSVAWQATTFAAVGLIVGLPLGDALGRWAWNLFAEQLGVIPETVTPVPLLLLIVPGAILLANAVAIVPGHVAARTRPAPVLRAE